jgi:hypothetical protein
MTKNCTTTLDGRLSEVTGGLPFPQLKQREHINPFAHTVNQSPDFPRSSGSDGPWPSSIG